MINSLLRDPISTHNPYLTLATRGVRITHPIIAIILAFVFAVASQVVLVVMYLAIYGPKHEDAETLREPALNAALQQSFLLVIPFAFLIGLIALWVAVVERRSPLTLGFEIKDALPRYALGAAIGLLAFCLAVAIMAVAGYVAFETGPAHLQGVPALGGAVVVMIGWIVQGAGEEVLCRGWLLQVVGARWNVWAGIIVSSSIFSILHALNPNVSAIALVNIFLVGIFMSLYVLREGSLWGICAWHSAWNWIQGNGLGFEVSGTPALGGTIVNLTETGPDAVTGGEFGPEAGLAVTLVIVVGIVLLALRKPKPVGE